MKTYRVWAKTTSWAYLDVEAEDEEEAYRIADSTDGGEFIGSDVDGDWEVQVDGIKEVQQWQKKQ